MSTLPTMLTAFLAQATQPAAVVAPAGTQAGYFVRPVFVLLLCVAAGFATYLALPHRTKHHSFSRIGGVLALLAFVLMGLLLAHALELRVHDGMGVYFWVFSALAIIGAFRVVTHRRPVYSALYFVLTVMASAGLFVLMWAEFMAAALVVIYAGAILVTYVFVIMLASQAQTPEGKSGSARATDVVAAYDAHSREPIVASVIGFALMGMLLFVIFDKANDALPATVVPPSVNYQYDTTVQALGRYLLTDQLVNLELAGLILTIAMVGAIVIARRRIVMTDGVAELVETPETDTINRLIPTENTSDDPHAIPVYGSDDPTLKAYPER